MSIKRDGKGRRRSGRRQGFSIESLERRALLSTASETFNGPALSGLIAQAEHGKKTTPSAINRMLSSLESQLTSGPLTDLNSGAVKGNGFVVESQSLETSYEQNVDKQFAAGLPNTDKILKLEGQRVVAELSALNQQNAVGLISSSILATSSRTVIHSLTAGPIQPLGTSLSAMTSTTKAFRSELYALAGSLESGSLTIDQVNTTLGAEAEAYRTDVHVGLQANNLRISGVADADINTLENKVNTIASSDTPNARPQLSAAIKGFVNSVLGTTGLFGPRGAYSQAPKTVNTHQQVTNGQVASIITGVSGTTASNGTATLNATLTSANGSPIAGENVAFLLDGAFAGVATTSFVGVATLTGVTTTDAVGTDTGGVFVHYASNTNFLSSRGISDLIVSPTTTSTALSAVSGTAVSGGTATLSATLTIAKTNVGIAGQNVNFTLDGTAVGTAITNSGGVATLTGVATIDAVGTNTGVIVASFTGNATNSAAANASGNLVVTAATTKLGSVSGTASFGGTAVLSANLTSATTGLPLASQPVNFTLDGVSVGTSVTDSTGLATLSGVATTDAIGTDTGGVFASASGAVSVKGNLVVTPATTTLSSVSGTASFGGTATVTAMLTSAVTDLGISGQSVKFTLDGTAVGTAVTDGNGVATLSGVATTRAIGTDTGGVAASFAGTTNYATSSGSGNLVVSQAATTLGGVSGTASFGGTATLTTTLTSRATNAGIVGQTVNFTLDGKSVGTAVTNSSGVATLTGVATTDGVGTDTGGVVVTYAGTTNYVASTGTGNLVVSQAATSLSTVAGTEQFGGTATLTATLLRAGTLTGISGQTINFTLDGTNVGTATTNNLGVATLTGVATTDGIGTDTKGVVASFAGSPDYVTTTAVTGNLVVSAPPATLGSVSGTASFGGPTSLTATLTSNTTGFGLSGQTVVFSVDGVVAGQALTNSLGVATLTGASTTDEVGTHTGSVVVTYAGTTRGTGNLIVNQAATALTKVSGTAPVGGPATLTATLISTVTGDPLSGQTVSFTLDSVVVGPAVTNSDGVATLINVPTSDPVGPDPNGVVVTFAGDIHYQGSQNKGDLTVKPV